MKDKVRPIYRELQAYLAQAPALTSNSDTTRDESLWRQLNSLVDELSEVTGQDWSRFKLTQIKHGQVTQRSPYYSYVYVSDYRAKLNGLIERLYGTYFFDESAPFGSSPSTVITQHQSQSQSTHVQILLDLQSKVDAEIPKHKEGTPERSFLEKVKSGLASIKNVNELIVMLLRIAKDLGLTPDQILKLFS